MLSFPVILIGVFGSAAVLLAVILLVVLLPRRDEPEEREAPPAKDGPNGDGYFRRP